jgi:predicted PurR-regulated permease PerM
MDPNILNLYIGYIIVILLLLVFGYTYYIETNKKYDNVINTLQGQISKKDQIIDNKNATIQSKNKELSNKMNQVAESNSNYISSAYYVPNYSYNYYPYWWRRGYYNYRRRGINMYQHH